MERESVPRFAWNGVVADFGNETLRDASGNPIPLRPRSFAVLRHLAENPRRVVTKDELMEAVWPGIAVTDDSLVQCIGEIRRAIGDEAHAVLKTVPRRGYKLMPPEGRAEAATGRVRGWALAVAVAAVLLAVAGFGAWRLVRTGPTGDIPRVAVLTFEARSDDAATRRLAAGLTDDIIADLARFKDFGVLASNTTRAYEAGTDPRRLRDELGASFVVDGSIDRQGEVLRITARLIDTRGGGGLWAQQWDRPAVDFFAIQGEIAALVANEVGGSAGLVQEVGRAAAGRKPPASLGAYELQLLAAEHLSQSTREGYETARDLLARAVAADPGLARAWIGLYWAHNNLAKLGIEADANRRRAHAIAAHAARLDPSDPLAHVVLGSSFANLGRFVAAEAEFEAALRLAPNSAAILTHYIGWASSFGKAEQGAELIERAIRLDPSYPVWANRSFGAAYFMAGRYDEAILMFERLGTERFVRWTWAVHGAALAAVGRKAEAADIVRQGLAKHPELSIEWVMNDPSWTEKEKQALAARMRPAGFPACAPPEAMAEIAEPRRLPECSGATGRLPGGRRAGRRWRWPRPSPSRARPYHHGNLRQALVAATLKLIEEKGPLGFTLADAARDAGVSAAAPYRHFRGRDELIEEVARQGFAMFADRLERAWNDGRPSALSAFMADGASLSRLRARQPRLLRGDVRERRVDRRRPGARARRRPGDLGAGPRRRAADRAPAAGEAAAGPHGREPRLVVQPRGRRALRPRPSRRLGAVFRRGDAGERHRDISSGPGRDPRLREGGRHARPHRLRRRSRAPAALLPRAGLSPVAGSHRPLAPAGRAGLLAAAGAVPCAAASRPWVLAATIVASAMAFIDGSVVTIALPVLQAEMGAGIGVLQWVVNGYMLFLGALLLVGGAAGDRFGRRRVFVAGIALFALASLGCALAPGAGALIGARAVQGIGAALMVPQSLAIISAAFPQEIRGRAIGTWAGAAAITTALGPAVGGFLIDSLGWRAAFWLNLPLAAVAVTLALAHVPESRAPEAGPLDWAGGLLAVLASGLLALGLTSLADPQAPGWQRLGARPRRRPPGRRLLPGRAGGRGAPGAAEALRLARLHRGEPPDAVPLRRALRGPVPAAVRPDRTARASGASQAGLVLLPMGLLIGLFARPVGGIADRLGVRGFLVAGSGLVAVAGAWLALGLEGLALGVVAPLLALAAGMALVVAPLTTAVMNAAPDALAGAASGVNNAASRLAGLFAVALVGAVTALVFGRAAGTDGAGFGGFPDPADPGFAAVTAAFELRLRGRDGDRRRPRAARRGGRAG